VAQMFSSDLDNAFKAPIQNPFYQIREKNFRALPLNKFPYLLFFEVLEEKKIVKIVGLFNTSQNPNKYPS
jgi:hypothetical protein